MALHSAETRPSFYILIGLSCTLGDQITSSGTSFMSINYLLHNSLQKNPDGQTIPFFFYICTESVNL
ncbi:hypothetical protein DBR11_28830 [Pedobacter sp. HMWF019]|nr:hypothetical protein DBR11_28830 [Pedobacter sp. HMWF019]